MTYYLWIFLFGAFVITKAQDLSLADALGDDDDIPTPKPDQPPKAGGDDLNLADAVLPEPEKPNSDPKQPVAPPHSGGEFSDTDLLDGKGEGNPGSSQGDQYDDAYNDQPKEQYQQWLKLLTLLRDNLPDGLLAWIVNSKQVIVSLLGKLLELLELAEEKQS